MLYGREAEQSRIARVLADAREFRRSHALVMRGETGIGKSALLEWAVQHGGWEGRPAGGTSGANGSRLLRATGYQAEENIAFAGLNQLLWPVRERLDALPEAQGSPLRGALGLAEHRSRDGQDRFVVGLAVLTVLADLAEDGPVLCLVDDAQWLDAATVEALLFAARRLAAEGVVMLFAARDEGFPSGGLEEMRLERLGPDDAERLLVARNTLPPAARERIIGESAGNPLALLEFGSAWHRRPGETVPLPLADRVIAAFREQIAALPDRTRLMLLIAAAEGRGHLPSALGAGKLLGAGLEDLEAAEQARLVEVTRASLRFRHPLVQAAAYQGAPAARRLEVHQALADATGDPDCGARHMAAAATVPDEEVAARLQRTADRARARMGHGTAGRLYQYAADLTPEPHARARRLAAAATAMLAAGDLQSAENLAGAAERHTDDPSERAGLVRVRAAVEFERGDPRTAARMLVDHAANGDEHDEGMLRTGAVYAWMAGETPALCRAADLLPPTDRATRGMAMLIRGEHADGFRMLSGLVRSARTGGRSHHDRPNGRDGTSGRDGGKGGPDRIGGPSGIGAGGDAVDAPVHSFQAVIAALIIGDVGGALELASAEAAHCRRHGLIGALPNVLEVLARAQAAAGLHQDAEATVAEAVGLARDTGLERRTGRLRAALTRIMAIEGDEDRLRTLLKEAGPWSPDATATMAFGLLDLGLGRYEEALRRFEELGGHPHRYSADFVVAAADQVEAAVRAGRPDRARPAHERVRAWADTTGQDWALAIALRGEAMLADPGDAAAEPYEHALDLHERAAHTGGRPFEKARTELLYGEWLRRARRRSDARAPLRSALETFERLQAAPWAERARSELRATGESGAVDGRRGASDGPAATGVLDRLTPQELQVVRLAAEGVSSREIAAQLFLSPRTVEYHLYKAYPKLGVSSRKELSHLRDVL